MRNRYLSPVLRWTLLLCLLGSGLLAPLGGSAQVGSGATLTVLRGGVAVLRADGTPLSQGASGMAIGVGDQISTLNNAGALVTFFEGSEVELGSNTTIVITEASRQGSRSNITIASIVGATVHRVVALTDSGSSYRVESGGTVGLIRGTVFGHYADPNGTVVLALQRCDAPPGAPERARTQCLEFPFEGRLVNVGTKVTYTPRGNTIVEGFRLNESLFNVITELPTDESGTENPGFNTGSRVFSQHNSVPPSEKDERQATATPDPCPPPTPGRTQLTAPSGTGAKELQVCSLLGFQVGDVIRINPGAIPSETGIISGFGSILLQNGTTFSYQTGTVVVLEPAAPIATITATTTGTPSPTTTITPAASQTPTSTPTATTPAIAPTSTPTNTPIVTPTSTVTGTPTSTATSTPTITATSSPTSTSTSTPTSTPSVTPTAAVLVSISDGSPDPFDEPTASSDSPMTFTVSLSRVYDQAVTVRYDTTSTGATDPAVPGGGCSSSSGVDYVSIANGSVTVPANANPPEVTFTITICGEDSPITDASYERFFVDISNITGGAIPATTRGTGTIRDSSIELIASSPGDDVIRRDGAPLPQSPSSSGGVLRVMQGLFFPDS